jgi:Flp pilus assembly protein TadG
MNRQTTKGQRGSVMVEMAIVLPVLLLLIIGGIDLDLMVTAKSSLNYVAGQTAECMVHNARCPSTTFAQTQATGLGLKASNISVSSVPAAPCPVLVTFPPPNPPCSVVVTVTYGWTPISPFLRAATLTSVATAVQ